MEKLKVEYIDTGELKPYENNAKIHTDAQIEQIARSIQEFGMNDPIAVWKDNEIIEGHGRLLACQLLGIKEVPIIRLDGLTDEQRRACFLMCGDSTDDDDVVRLICDDKIDMVLSDPPYGMKLDTDYSSMKSKLFKGKTGGAEYREVIGDNDDFSPELIETFFRHFGYVDEMFLFGADYFAELIPNRNEGSWLVWDKRLNDSADKMYGSCFELIWSKNRHKRDILRYKWAGIFGMESQDTEKRIHPTQKPTTMLAGILNEWGGSAKTVLDLYGGSGSTLIACEQLGRKCYMMEYDPHYCDVIIDRWEKFTGKTAEKVNDDGQA